VTDAPLAAGYKYGSRIEASSGDVSGGSWNMADALIAIEPYWHEGAWVFDDASRGLEKEPLEGCFEAELREIKALARLIGGGVTKMIDYLVKDVPDAREGFILLLSSQPFSDYQVELSRVAEEDGGFLYRGKNHSAEAWLSPALFKYFETAPESLYVKAESRHASDRIRGHAELSL
jgi:hypothetical protein